MTPPWSVCATALLVAHTDDGVAGAIGGWAEWHLLTVRELIALAKSKPPGTISYAIAGPATNPHICGELLNYLGKINLFVVHYKGGGFATTATISGENQVFFSNTISDVLPQVEAKRLRALGVTGLKRSPVAPQIPTLPLSRPL